MIIDENEWQISSENLVLAAHEVHVWHGILQGSQAEIQDWYSLLTSDEQARANRFYFERDRTRFIVGRGYLRKILGMYLSILPQEIQFNYNEHGKPYLNPSHNVLGLEFNVSHSQDQALFAVTTQQPVGIDIEAQSPEVDHVGIMQRFFSPREVQDLHSVASEQQLIAFYNGWTRKEAVMKLMGTGFAIPLRNIEVSIKPDAVPELYSFAEKNIKLYELQIVPHYAAALAIHDTQPIFKYWRCQFGSHP